MSTFGEGGPPIIRKHDYSVTQPAAALVLFVLLAAAFMFSLQPAGMGEAKRDMGQNH